MEQTVTSVIRNINLHPNNHVLSSEKTLTFDVVIIGSGPSSRELARRTAAEKLKTIIIEEELFGGDCPYWACIPSKALLRPSEAIEAAKQIGGAHEMIRDSKPTIDVKAVFARRDKFVNHWNDQGLIDLLESQGASVIRGRGALAGKNKVQVTSQTGESVLINAKEAVVLATGSSAKIPDIPGLQSVGFWTSREANATNEVPKRLIIIGGGVVGCEMATFFGNITKVSLITSAKELLPHFEPEAGKRVREALVTNGVNVFLTTKVNSFQAGKSDDNFEAHLSNGKTISASKVMLATGRKPNTDRIGLEHLKIPQNSKLPMDDSLCVAETGWLYAIGDVNERNLLTHMGAYHARAVANTIVARAKGESFVPQPWDKFSATSDHASGSQVVMTDPNVASAGLTLSQAKAQGFNVKEVTSTFQFPGAWLYAEFNYEGWGQWVVDTDREVLLGATFVGRQAGDLLHASTVAIVGQVPISRLWHAVASFPTMSEIYTALLRASGF